MTTIIAILALVSLPLVLDMYFNSSSASDHNEEEYIPDGR
jgi:hypothetical protein